MAIAARPGRFRRLTTKWEEARELQTAVCGRVRLLVDVIVECSDCVLPVDRGGRMSE